MAKTKSLDELKTDYDAAYKRRKKDPTGWQAAKHAYRTAEHTLNHPEGEVRVGVQPAEARSIANN